MNDININEQFDFSVKTEAEKTTKKNAFLGATIIWFFYAIIIAFASAFVTLGVFSRINFTEDSITKFWFVWIALAVAFIILSSIEFYAGPRMNFWIQLIIITVAMAIFGALFLSTTLLFLVLKYFQNGSIRSLIQILAVILIPLLLIGILGICAYYDLIKIKAWYIAFMVLSIGFFVIFFLSFFITRSWIDALWPTIGFALMVVYMAIDWFIITRFNKAYNITINKGKMLRKEILKYTIYFGFKLAFDYLYAVIYLARIFRNN